MPIFTVCQDENVEKKEKCRNINFYEQQIVGKDDAKTKEKNRKQKIK